MTRPRVAALYCRISDDREGRRLGVQRQEEDGRAMLERLGYDDIIVFVENDTGASTRSKKPRPKFERMVAMAEAGELDAIGAYGSHRLTRRPMENERLIALYEQHGVLTHYVSSDDNDLSTARGRRRARDDAARDAEDVEYRGELVTRAARQRAEAGRGHGGTRPYGWQAGDRRKLDPYEHQVKLDAASQILAGDPLRTVVRDLAARGIPPASWRPPLVVPPWSPTSVRDMLTNWRQCGLRVYKDEVIGPGDWEPAFDEITVRQLRRILLDPDRQTSPTNARRYLLPGIALCCDCGDPVGTKLRTSSKRAKRWQYWCEPCGLYRVMAPVDLYVETYIRRLLVNYKPVPDPGADPDAERLVAELNERIEETIARFTGSSAVRPEQLEKILGDLNQQLRAAEARAFPPRPLAPVLAGLTGDRPAVDWDSLSLDRKRTVIEGLVTVTLHRAKSGRRPFDPETVVIERRGDS